MAQDKTSTPVNSQKKAMDLYLAAKAAEAAERDFGKTYIEPLGPGEEITRPDNFLYEALSNPRLNRGLSNIGEAFIGEGTGSITGDLLAGLAGGGAGIATELAGGESGAADWIPGGSLAKAGMLGVAKKFRPSNALPYEKFREMLDKVNELSERWIIAKTSAGEDPRDWFRMSRAERNDFLKLNGVDPHKGRIGNFMDRAVNAQYNIMNEDRVEDLLGRDIAELAPEKKAYSTPYMGVIEPPGGATERLLMSPFEDIPEKPAELVNPLTGATETEAERAARRKALLANAATSRKKATSLRTSQNESSKRYYAKKVAEKEAAVNAAEKAKLKEASDLWKAEKARIGSDEVLPGWKVSEHRLGENDSPALRGRTPTTYEELLGEGATNRDKRAGYYLDSLAGVAAGRMRRKENPESLTRADFSDKKHNYTTYDEAVRKFYDDVEEGIRNGNLPGDGRIVLKPDWNRSIGLFQHPFVKMPDGTEKDLYELLVRPKTNLKTEQILRYAGQL